MPFCSNCGYEVGEGDTFCKNCGSPVKKEAPPQGPPPAAPPPYTQPPPAQAQAAWQPQQAPPSKKNTLWIVLGIVIPVVLAGTVLGIVFGVKGCSEQKAVENADKYITESLGYINEVEEIEDNLFEATKNLDLTLETSQLESQVEDIHDQLTSAITQLDAAASSLQKIEKEKLPDWWDDYIAMLNRAYAEKIEAYREWDEFITRLLEIDQFNQAYQAMLQTYLAALGTLDAAVQQHDSEDYSGGKATCYTALDQLAQARAALQEAQQLEPGADLSQFEAAIGTVEGWIPGLQSACDLGNAGQIEQHNAVVDQIRPAFNALPRDVGFDIIAWFQAERDAYIISIEEHLAKEAEYRRRAADIWNANNP